ncbi:MAG: hypothetical protein AB8B48_16200 [Pseudomonadales bacterium]
MKSMLLLLFLASASQAYSWECLGEHKGIHSKFGDHISYASEIYLGNIMNAYLVESSSKIVFELSVSDVLKGTYKRTVTLSSLASMEEPEISVGQSYIFFLYDNQEVDSCGISIKLHHVNSLEWLRETVTSSEKHSNYRFFDEATLNQLRELLVYADGKP